ncbi:MAG: GNAT family N-acetyltransferase [Pricia sp.]|nr:GNAT family N-acetyltransferase [Pricia sp.]
MTFQNFYISTDLAEMDSDFIHDYLSKRSYWAKDRSRDRILKSLKNSLCFGLFDRMHKQIGFARLVTDYVVFAWLMDVFVDEKFRGKGLGKKLIEHIIELPELQNVNGIGLRTKDAHRFYEKFGFKSIDDPKTWMLLKKQTT